MQSVVVGFVVRSKAASNGDFYTPGIDAKLERLDLFM